MGAIKGVQKSPGPVGQGKYRASKKFMHTTRVGSGRGQLRYGESRNAAPTQTVATVDHIPFLYDLAKFCHH